MKKYMEYMDSVRASDTLHQRLLGLEAAGKRPTPWKRYGAVAAALALVVGAGAWGMAHGGWNALAANFQSDANAEPGIPDVDVPEIADIAIVEPGDVTEPAEKTLGGYDVTSGSGPNAMVTHYILPYIDYGTSNENAEQKISMDWALQEGAVDRELTQEEIAALLGGTDAVSTHLDWDAYELTGRIWERPDGSMLLAFLYGYAGELDHFEFGVMPGSLPPTCIAYAGSVTQEIRGLTVTADKYDGEYGCDRRVSFMKDNYGYRFDLTSTDAVQAERLVSRLVCHVADRGLELTYDCPYCGHTFPFGAVHHDPLISAERGYTCSNCGQFVPAGEKHSHTFVGEGEIPEFVPDYDPTYEDGLPEQDTSANDPKSYAYNEPWVCPDCGAHVPAGEGHTCELCQLPLAPDTETCPDCGVTYPAGEAHYHTHTCEVCGQALPAGVEHSHQEEHHQEHHSDHH